MNLCKQAHQPTKSEYRTIQLTQGQKTIVDAADYEYLSQWKWMAHWSPCTQTFYAARNSIGGTRFTIKMHRVIMHATKGAIVDHRDHNTLDNRRQNLRLTTATGNCCNAKRRSDSTSGLKGASWNMASKKWLAQIQINKKKIHLGYFPTAEAAHEAYKEAAVELHGEFACW